MNLKPFWRYYGGKYRAAPRYPKPEHRTIVEPFAGAAGYALRYPDRDVILIDKYPVVTGIWKYLIRVSEEEIQRIPTVQSVDELPSWVPQEGRDLVGFWMSAAVTAPRKTLSSGRKQMAAAGRKFEGWTQATKDRVSSQLSSIRHWKVVAGDYSESPEVEATWFIDPPYANKAGSYYIHHELNLPHLAAWCLNRKGQVIVCENEGANWLPFQTFGTFKPGINGNGSREVIWQKPRAA